MFIFHFSVKKNDQQNPLAGIEKNKDTKKSQKIIIDFRKSSIADFLTSSIAKYKSVKRDP